jgi:vitamin B12 transporter
VRFEIASILLAGVLGGVMPAVAQSPSAGTPEEPPTIDDEVTVVTASLDEEEPADLPVAVTVITAREIGERQAKTVLELLRTTPGVAVTRSGGPGAVTSAFVRGANSSQTLVLWNGVQLNDPYFRGFDWAFLPTDGARRVEIVRGPASTLYGSEAMGGVVQVLSGGEPGTDLTFEGGTDDSLRGGLSTTGSLGGAVSYQVAGHVRRGDGPLVNDGYDGEDLMARADWAATDELTVGLLARVHASEVGLPLGFAGPTPHRLQDRDSTQIALPVTWERGPWEVSGQLLRTTTDLAVSDGDDPFGASRSDARRDGARLVTRRQLGASLWAAVGADWEREEVTSGGSFGPVVTDRNQESRAGFGELHWSHDRGSVVVGARRDDSDTFGGATTVRLGGVVELGASWALRAHYGEGFRAPSLGELYFPFASNPDLQPETSDTTEVGLAWTDGPTRVAVTVFDTDFRDLVVYPAPLFVPVNVGRAEARGVEAEAVTSWSAWTVRANATWLDTEDLATGLPLLRRPERAGNVLVTWRPRSVWTVHGGLSHVGEREDFGATLDAYTTLDLAIARSFGRFEPYARVENALDEEYEEAAGFPTPGRTVVGGIALRWPGLGQ